jgi:hypothetical protein
MCNYINILVCYTDIAEQSAHGSILTGDLSAPWQLDKYVWYIYFIFHM